MNEDYNWDTPTNEEGNGTRSFPVISFALLLPFHQQPDSPFWWSRTAHGSDYFGGISTSPSGRALLSCAWEFLILLYEPSSLI